MQEMNLRSGCANGSLRKPTRADVVQWISSVWGKVTMATSIDTYDRDDIVPVANQPTVDDHTYTDLTDKGNDFVLAMDDDEVAPSLWQHNFINDNEEEAPFHMELTGEDMDMAIQFHSRITPDAL
jgi:hypothetical protein